MIGYVIHREDLSEKKLAAIEGYRAASGRV
jgi:hypothetical protein